MDILKNPNKEFANTGELAIAPARLGTNPTAPVNSYSRGFDSCGADSRVWIL
jgi:hypothetical protein